MTAAAGDARPLVLNVDDTEAARYAKTRALEVAGLPVAEAVTGAEALALVEALGPALVLLDVKLPDIDGIEVCRRIKRAHPDIMVLQISASYVGVSDRVRGLDGGADVYLTQPVEPQELVAAVRALLRLHAAEHALRGANETLEARVRARTAELADANARLVAEMAERERTEAVLVQAQKMEAVGQLTGGIAHDFNNLLTAVIGGLDLIERRTEDPRTRRLAINALEAARRGAKLTGQLLSFSRIQKLTPAAVDVNALIAGMAELLDQAVGPAHRVVVEASPAAPWVLADPNQLELTLLNLAINARDASPPGSDITLRTEPREGEGAPVAVTVSDRGVGMTPQVLARAFDPFFTTKGPGKGTGLGLSQVFGFAKQSGGSVEIDTRPGEGATVRLLLPRTHAGAPAPADAGAPPPPGDSRSVLVVDDDDHVREFVCEVLAGGGYEVVGAASGQGGLEALRERDFDLVLLDFAMPELNGAEVAEAARRLRPDARLLFVTGYADTDAIRRAAPGAELLHKPFDTPTLLARVRALTEGVPA